MFQFKKLAIAGAITASLMGATAAQAHVSYNYGPQSSTGQFPTTTNAALAAWTGGAPTGYTGKLQVDWVANIHNDVLPNASYNVSAAEAVAEGAPNTFKLTAGDRRWNPSSSWGSALDFGLIDLHSAGNLTITVEADASGFVPGFTLFSGWDTGTGGNKHQAWNSTPTNPGKLGTTGLTYIGHDAAPTPSIWGTGSSVTHVFSNLTAGHYSLWIGGNGPTTQTTLSAYKATITASPVPVPGAVWLFGTAIAGMVGVGRRKAAISA